MKNVNINDRYLSRILLDVADTPALRLWKEIRERREEEDTRKKKRQVLFNGCINRANEFFFYIKFATRVYTAVY